MHEWSRRTYGDPCRQCGFSWGLDRSTATALVADVVADLTETLAKARGSERHPDLEWPVVAYVAHIGDNLRIWAERLAGIALGGPSTVESYDERMLGDARSYESMGLAGACWSLGRATRDWTDAVGLAPAGLVMIHPVRGQVRLDEIVCANAHDAVHHAWDIDRSLHSTS